MPEAWERQLIRKYPKYREGDYERMLEAQGGVCKLCGKKPGRTRFAVDHDHVTGRIRGLVHSRCNRAFGVFEWSVETLTRLRAYAQATIRDRTRHADRHAS